MKNKFKVSQDGLSVEVELTQGQTTIIDIQDMELVGKYRWHAAKSRGGFRATTNVSDKDGRFKTLYLYRLLTEPEEELVVDHEDHDQLNNRRSNLRVCTQAQNSQNRTSRKNSSSEYLGVSWFKRDKKWGANIQVNYKSLNLGRFKSEIDAVKAYNKAALYHFGEFANLNVIKEQ